tara:strand:- start:40 stop:723 length:684 start_codon:yes stop_codon:yes gene_type:complete
MAKASDIQDPFERMLSVPIDYLVLQKTAGAATWTYSGGSKDWLPVPSYDLAQYNAQSIDLSGYALQELTFFPELGFLQQHPQVALENGGAVTIANVISTVPLDIDVLFSAILVGGAPAITFENSETILYCRIDNYLANVNAPNTYGILIPNNSSQMGSLQPTSADKLFVYRLVIPIGVTTADTGFTRLNIPAARIGLIGMMMQEPDIEYLMRQKRSYELANQIGAGV